MRVLARAARRLATVAAVFCLGSASAGADEDPLARIVGDTIRALMAEHDVPGMAVGIVVRGERRVFAYGVASRADGRKVTADTLFEVGSVSKTFTATLGAYAQARGALALSDMASDRLPALAGTGFDRISLLDLATYAAGGLPLQFPGAVDAPEAMIAFYRGWRPAFPPGARRLYSNPSIGLFGHIAARSLGRPFEAVMPEAIFAPLGLKNTFLRVPAARMADYAWGYVGDGAAVRVRPGMLDAETYGIKTTASDLIRFVAANINGADLDDALRRAIADTHLGHFDVGPMVQGLGWEMIAPPATLERLQAANAREIILEPQPVRRLDPPRPPEPGALFDKTGSTKGFGAYVVFAPSQGVGVALLANRNYPIPARVAAAHRILSALGAVAP
ncbi:beta-lactamase class C [Methylopila capsulata]|uniref:Beta-lactamase n=1 Tax=Methylopila capsulata TaxID=61654 RepID=A0A9W6IV15_9HYPH|nr:class C beta-lactamase [Methylopila capsulata]MBM7850510.1 beta-lactamase class C [Methylopila capsulata]GLK55805.1 beta-lactamase [Methylopila capsulata]